MVAGGKQSRDLITWTDDLLTAFNNAQQALKNAKTITLPVPDDVLWIITDGSVKQTGIAATLYVLRNKSPLLAGFFNAKLKKHQVTWLPCEIEALCIGAAVKHFAPYLIQSIETAHILTDSRPCVQAYDKLCRGEFSASSRVTTFLSTVSRYQAQVSHIAGVANLPSDYTSRHPIECQDKSCQICKFVAETEESVVYSLSIKDVIDGHIKMPFTTHSSWLNTQLECPDLRRTHAHLTQGTRPTKKTTTIPDVKKYLRNVKISNSGLLVVKDNLPLQPERERIVIPRKVIDGLLTALHLRFNHPTAHQMHRLASRYFYALNLDDATRLVTNTCHHCTSVKTIPKELQTQSTMSAPKRIGTRFAADVMRRYRQCILIILETTTSYTFAMVINNEQKVTMLDAILTLCSSVLCLDEGGITIRVDPAPAFVALVNSPILNQHNISIDIGQIKNVNKNPVAERAIEEIGLELLHMFPEGGPITPRTLALATSMMNMRIRRNGMSARELWTQRDQLTGDQLPFDDADIILQQHQSRITNHPSSAKAKANKPVTNHDIKIGDLVYLKPDRDKTKAKEKYMIINISDEWCQVRKFTKTQFRSKTYDMKISECLPITITVLARSPPGPIRGIESPQHSDDEEECDPLAQIANPPSYTTDNRTQELGPAVLPPIIETPPIELVQPYDNITSNSMYNNDNPNTLVDLDTTKQTTSTAPERRSSRSTKGNPPKWLHADTWDRS